MRRKLATALGLVLAGCAQSYQPVVDMKGVDTAKYQQDLYECRQYAEQVSPVERAAGGALLGAAGGAALGAITGGLASGVSAGSGAALGAATGGAVGAGVGGVTGVEQQKQIIDNCLRGRGYNVLN